MTDVLDEVYAVIADRKANPKEGSYTTSLYNHRKGLDKVLEKIGEESTELIIAAKDKPLEKVKKEFERRRK